MDIFTVTVPQLGINDEKVIIVEWHISDYNLVSIGTPLCTLESSKATFEVESEANGYFLRLIDAGSEVKLNDPIALIGPDLETLKTEKRKYLDQARVKRSYQKESVKATQKAQDLAQRLNITLERILVKGGVIREQDVIKYYEQNKPGGQKTSRIKLSWDKKKKPVIVYGAGKGAITIKECLSLQDYYELVCFIDDNIGHQSELCGLPVYHSSKLPEIVNEGVCTLACGIANGGVRLRIRNECESMGIDLINVIHPKTYISPTVKIGKGNYIKAGAVIETDSVIGDCCIIDNGVILAHNNIIGDGCHIAPGVVMGSKIEVGALTIIGIGASIATGVKIGRATVISVGSSVTKDIADYSIVEGVPGRVVGKRKLSEKKINYDRRK